jgi:hypothetical protein
MTRGGASSLQAHHYKNFKPMLLHSKACSSGSTNMLKGSSTSSRIEAIAENTNKQRFYADVQEAFH